MILEKRYMEKYLILFSIFIALSCSGCSNSKEKEEDSSTDITVESELGETSDNEMDNTDEESDTNEKNDTEDDQETTSVSEEEEWTPLTIDQAPEGYNCEFCLGCGKTSDEGYISRYGYCDPCFNLYKPCGSCSVCGGAMSGSDTIFYDGTRCSACASRCDYCGGYLDEDTFDSMGGQYVDSLCYIRYIVGCANCGAKNDTVDASTGLCYDCMKEFGAYDICPVCGAEYQNNSGYGMCYDCYNAQSN